MREEFAVLDHQIDARDVHVHDAAGADVEVADFAVAHLAFGQPDKRAAGVNQRVGILAQQAVVGWLARERDGIGFGFGAISPAVEDDENERFRTGHKFAFSSWLLAVELPRASSLASCVPEDRMNRAVVRPPFMSSYFGEYTIAGINMAINELLLVNSMKK